MSDPVIFTRFIDNPIRRRFVQRLEAISDRFRMGPGMVMAEIGQGKGS